MYFEDYRCEVMEDSKRYIDENYEWYDDFDELYDALFTADSVTGNGSGSYYFNSWKAKEAVKDVVWDDEFLDAISEFGWSLENLFKQGPEAIDVVARCAALSYIPYNEMEEHFYDLKEGKEEE